MVTLSVQMWSHYPDKCDHTVGTNVININHAHILSLYVVCRPHRYQLWTPVTQHIWTYLGPWYNFKPCWSIDFTESHDTCGAEVGVEAGLQTQFRRPEKDSQLMIRLGNVRIIFIIPFRGSKTKRSVPDYIIQSIDSLCI